MGEVIYFGKKFDQRRSVQSFIRDIEIPEMLTSVIDAVDANSESTAASEIIDNYQSDILSGVVAKEALKNAILRARRLSQ